MSDVTLTATPPARRLALALLALTIGVGAFLGSAGWATRLPDVDTYPYVYDAGELIRHGTLPVLGNVQSFGGFNPPGDAYLFVPGALLFHDVRLWELPSAVACYVALVAGVRLLLGRSLAPTPATIAASGFALSAGAVETAGTLWTRMQSPAFVVWTLVFLVRWADRRNAWWLAAALATWVASLYVFPETLLAGAMFPAVWLLRRPPMRAGPIACVIAASACVAWPFLAYESRHGFTDVARIVTQAKPIATDVRATWCDPTRTLIEVGDDGAPRPATPPAAVRPATLAGRLLAKAAAIGSVGVAGFARDGPGGLVLLAVFAVAGVGLCRGAAAGRVTRRLATPAAIVVGVACLAVAATLSGTVARALVGDRLPVTPQALGRLFVARVALAGLGVVLLTPRLRALALRRVVPAIRDGDGDGDGAFATVALPTLAAYAATLLFATPDRAARAWQLWPLIAVVGLVGIDRWLAATTTLGARSRGAIVAIVAATLVFNGAVVARVRDVARDGWAGRTPPIVTLLDVVARASAGRADVRLGTHVAAVRYEFFAPQTDARARVGSGGDAYLLNRYGLTNRTRCTEGFGDGDEWRIVGPPEAGKQLVAPRPGEYDGWQPIATAGALRLLHRP